MKNLAKILMTSAIVLILGLYLNSSELYAQNLDQKPGKGFIDLNGDGINDNAIDSDGDGIPNCIDPDIVRQQNRVGNQYRNGNQYSFWYRYNYKHNFKNGYGYGPGDGTGNSGVGPRDGTGFGPGQGTGTCDGTGPKGKQRGGRR